MATRSTVFGLDVGAAEDLSFLRTATAPATGRRLEIELVGVEEVAGWAPGAELICDQRRPDGSIGFQIFRSERDGYKIWGTWGGLSVLSAGADQIRGTAGAGGMEGWQRLLVAQVLPLASLVRGLEVLHASAVVVDGAAIAFVGHSGSGKTSLALALHEVGAGLLTDDVLALERVDGDLLGYPGAPVAGIDAGTADPVLPGGGEVLSVDARERVTRVRLVDGPAPLRAVIFLDRRPDGPAEPCFESVASPQELLGATFNFVLATPERLIGLLDVCAAAARQRVERLVFGPGTGVHELSTIVTERLRVAA